jgi:hypothetical protein
MSTMPLTTQMGLKSTIWLWFDGWSCASRFSKVQRFWTLSEPRTELVVWFCTTTKPWTKLQSSSEKFRFELWFRTKLQHPYLSACMIAILSAMLALPLSVLHSIHFASSETRNQENLNRTIQETCWICSGNCRKPNKAHECIPAITISLIFCSELTIAIEHVKIVTKSQDRWLKHCHIEHWSGFKKFICLVMVKSYQSPLVLS